jgi:hypothetical protein
LVPDDGKHPRSELSRRLITGCRLPHADEDLLRDIVRLSFITTEQTRGNPDDRRVVFFHQLGKRSLIALGRRLNPRQIFSLTWQEGSGLDLVSALVVFATQKKSISILTQLRIAFKVARDN